jgi:hypothetical protein
MAGRKKVTGLNSAKEIPRVFVSYSHDSPEHMGRVLRLSDRLRGDGIDCRVDRYEDAPPKGGPQWMVDQIQAADFVLVVCTEAYCLKFNGERGGKGEGLGARWEGSIITVDLYYSGANNTKFVPVLFFAEDKVHIPVVLRSATWYEVAEQWGYEALLRRLTNRPLIHRPVLNGPQSMLAGRRGRLSSNPMTLWTVPHRRNPYFFGRDRTLKELWKALTSESRVQAIVGLGGVGKTQTAVEYAYRYKEEYGAVLWFRAESKSIVSSFTEMARVMGLVGEDTKEVEALHAVRHWLVDSGDWLMVFDNAENPEDIKPFLPVDPKGHALITSRAQVFHGLHVAKPVTLDTLRPEDSLKFLLKRTVRENCDPRERAAAAGLAKELGHLPLALEQAGAFIYEKGSLFQNYLRSYLKYGLELLNKSKPIVGDCKESVSRTWLITFNQVKGNPRHRRTCFVSVLILIREAYR